MKGMVLKVVCTVWSRPPEEKGTNPLSFKGSAHLGEGWGRKGLRLLGDATRI